MRRPGGIACGSEKGGNRLSRTQPRLRRDGMYPIAFALDHESENRNRLTAFFRSIVVIPWQIVAYIWGIAAGVVTFIAWFALLFTGRFSEGLYNPLRAALAYNTRASAYFLLMTEDYPPFSYDEAVEQPQLASGSGPGIGAPAPQEEERPPEPPPGPPPGQP